MPVYFSHEEEFAERFQRSLGFWVRAFENAALVLLVLGVGFGVGRLWDDHERLPVILLLTGIGLLGFMCYSCLLGILAELAYRNERSAKRNDEPA